MNRVLALSALILSASTLGTAAPAPSASVVVPREKIRLSCPDAYFKTARQNFLLVDETYPRCVLRVPLALKARWPGERTFYFIPRMSASLHAKDGRGQGRWLPLSPLVNLGADPLHRAVASSAYEAVELSGRLGNLGAVAGDLTPDTVSAGGKLTVCVAPVLRGEAPCTTFDLTARYRVYLR
ncbi:hypothetical protein [Deinococcus hohokamensis]|uniref:Uncharacterized protein n=1 Tax=Deinococcus hohokamensis TaxID=309883 RepID=A0ABV9IA95_9DEIO